jgi:hypothetical protein
MAEPMKDLVESSLELIASSRVEDAALKLQLTKSVRLLEKSRSVLAKTPPKSVLIGAAKLVEIQDRPEPPAA